MLEIGKNGGIAQHLHVKITRFTLVHNKLFCDWFSILGMWVGVTLSMPAHLTISLILISAHIGAAVAAVPAPPLFTHFQTTLYSYQPM